MRSINRCRHVKRGPPHPLQLGQCLCERTRFQDRWPRSNAADFVAAPSPSLRVTEANTGREGIVSWANLLRAVLTEMLIMIVEQTYVSARLSSGRRRLRVPFGRKIQQFYSRPAPR